MPWFVMSKSSIFSLIIAEFNLAKHGRLTQTWILNTKFEKQVNHQLKNKIKNLVILINSYSYETKIFYLVSFPYP